MRPPHQRQLRSESLPMSCPGGTQLAAYAGWHHRRHWRRAALQVRGFDATSTAHPPLPEGMSFNQDHRRNHQPADWRPGPIHCRIRCDRIPLSNKHLPLRLCFNINGSNAFLAKIFPSTSIFHHRVDAASTGLPVDTSPAAPMYSGYLPATVKPFFGNGSDAPFPNGIPAIEVPCITRRMCTCHNHRLSELTTPRDPFPGMRTIEAARGSQMATGMCLFILSRGSNLIPTNPGLLRDVAGNLQGWSMDRLVKRVMVQRHLKPAHHARQGNIVDAAGLPVAPLLVNADEVIGTGTCRVRRKGVVKHPVRFTLNHMLNYWVWPATETAGVGSCKLTGGARPFRLNLRFHSQRRPQTCSMSGPAGEIYRLKASVRHAGPRAANQPAGCHPHHRIPQLRNHPWPTTEYSGGLDWDP